MGSDIRRGQYDPYCECKDILKRLPRLLDEPPVTDLLPFNQWTTDSQCPWTQLETHLLETASAGPLYTRAPAYNDDEDDSDATDGDTKDSDDDNDDDAEDEDSEQE